jgi:large subunit ribosomal protein L25
VLKYLEDESFFTSILELKAKGGQRQKVVLRDMQRHPAKPIIMHMDFQRVRDDVELTINIPLHFLNEDTCKAAKTAGVIVSHQITEVEVTCLPGDLPEYIQIDLTDFKEGDAIRLSEIKLPKGVSLTAFTHGEEEEHDEIVVSTSHVQVLSEETEETEAPVASEVPSGQDDETSEEES